MGLMEVSLIHHLGIVLVLLWLLSAINCCHAIFFFISLIYLYLVHERYVMRLRRKLQFEERKQANQRKVLSDTETVRWLNRAVEQIWPICMEQITSQKILLPIIPWFLEKYEPWICKQAMVQHLYLGRNPPMFTEMRVLHQPSEDDHLVLELGMNFVTADDMSAILAVKLRKRLGFGLWAKLHLTGMHVEGKVLVGIKFLRDWPLLGRLRLCFAQPPYFQINVKPIFSHGLDVAELPGIAGWLDKLLSTAFEETLVQPNMLVVDMEKFVSPQSEPWFSVNVKEPVAYVKVEVIEGSDMKAADLNGLSDPYVEGQLGSYKFRTKTQKKTLAPKWQEEFKIPIVTWDSKNVLAIKVHDKDHFYDDTLGHCSVKIMDLRDNQRHDIWLPLQNVKTGRLHLAITILEDKEKVDDHPPDLKEINVEEESPRNSMESDTAQEVSFSPASSQKSHRMADNYEPINIEGQKETGIWVHRPGSEVPKTWEPREGRNRRVDIEIEGKHNDLTGGSDENTDQKSSKHPVRRGLRNIGSVFQRGSGKEDQSGSSTEPVRSPYANIRAVNKKEGGLKFVAEESRFSGTESGKAAKEGKPSPEGSDQESPSKSHMKDMAKNIFKQSARGLKYAFSRKGSRGFEGDSLEINEREKLVDSDSSDDETLPPCSPAVQDVYIVSEVAVDVCRNDSFEVEEDTIQPGPSDSAKSNNSPVNKVSHGDSERIENKVEDSPNKHGDRLVDEP